VRALSRMVRTRASFSSPHSPLFFARFFGIGIGTSSAVPLACSRLLPASVDVTLPATISLSHGICSWLRVRNSSSAGVPTSRQSPWIRLWRSSRNRLAILARDVSREFLAVMWVVEIITSHLVTACCPVCRVPDGTSSPAGRPAPPGTSTAHTYRIHAGRTRDADSCVSSGCLGSVYVWYANRYPVITDAAGCTAGTMGSLSASTSLQLRKPGSTCRCSHGLGAISAVWYRTTPAFPECQRRLERPKRGSGRPTIPKSSHISCGIQ
jgi:hypothetical protein